jgi:hypothetical protein
VYHYIKKKKRGKEAPKNTEAPNIHTPTTQRLCRNKQQKTTTPTLFLGGGGGGGGVIVPGYIIYLPQI